MEVSAITTNSPNVNLGSLAVQSQLQTIKPPVEEKAPITHDKLSELVKSMNTDMASINDHIKFGFSEELKQLVVEVKDVNTGNVIQTFPSEDALHLAKKVKELVGIIFDTKG